MSTDPAGKEKEPFTPKLLGEGARGKETKSNGRALGFQNGYFYRACF